MRKFPALLLVLMLSGCAAQKIHPGSPNQFDSTTYDTLITTKSVIDTTRTDLANGAFPANISANVKAAENILIQAYNALDIAYQAYHTAALGGTSTQAQQDAMTNALTQVNTATAALTSAKVSK